MFNKIGKNVFSYSPFRIVLLIFLTTLFIIIVQDNIPKIKYNSNNTISLIEEINKHTLSFISLSSIYDNKTFETTIQCIGSLYNQSCLYKNLYYVDSTFMILTVKGKHLPVFSVRTDAFILWSTTPNKREFDSYSDLEKFVRFIINPKIIPSVTLYFGQPWHHNIGHALFRWTLSSICCTYSFFSTTSSSFSYSCWSS